MAHASARNPSDLRSRIAAQKAMAISALHADSSLAVRLKRYNEHMKLARALELLLNLTRTLRVGGGK